MSKEYDKYLYRHRENVKRAFYWLDEYLPGLLRVNNDEQYDVIENRIIFHDNSKFYKEEEYDAYDAYFYGGKKTDTVIENFNKAWHHHLHCNKHHWQYWTYLDDCGEIKAIDKPYDHEYIIQVKAIDMPYEYIIEMICDWWSFSFEKGNLYEIFDWYEKHKHSIVMSFFTRCQVETILCRIKDTLDELEAKKMNVVEE